MAAAWPTSLPSIPAASGYTHSAPNVLIRQEVEQGPSRVRRKCTSRPWRMTFTMTLSKSQIALLETFVYTTLEGGALRFTFTDPTDLSSVECRIVPISDSDLYTLVPDSSGTLWTLSITLEILP